MNSRGTLGRMWSFSQFQEYGVANHFGPIILFFKQFCCLLNDVVSSTDYTGTASNGRLVTELEKSME
jgi:hypothetical protein